MITRALPTDGTGQDGLLITWEPGKLLTSVADPAFTEAGYGKLLPKASTKSAALRAAFGGLIDGFQMKVRGQPIAITALQATVTGFEACRVRKGKVDNEHEFLLSVVVQGDDVKIGRAEHSKLHPMFASNPEVIEGRLTEAYKQELDYYPVSMVTSALQRLVIAMNGISLRQAGGTYFLPGPRVDEFTDIIDKIDGTDGGLIVNTVSFPIAPNERSYRWVLNSLAREVAEDLTAIEEGLADLEGSGQRSDGKESRLSEASRIDSKISEYESLLGVTLQGLHDAVEKVKLAVNCHAVLGICS